MTYERRPVPPEAELIALAMHIRTLTSDIRAAEDVLNELLDRRASEILTLWDHGLRYTDLQRLLQLNGGSIAGALNRARRLRAEAADQPADASDFTNERTLSVTGPPDLR